MPAASGIAYKAYEIEELVDIYFFRRLGIVVAHAARMLGISPNGVSIISGVVGAVGGALLVDDRSVFLGVVLIVGHGVFDSADGQLARLTGRTSEWGRVLDGLSGYVTHTAAYLAIVVRVIRDGGSWWILPAGVLAGVATAIHAQLYDYHRTAYAAIVVNGRPTLAANRRRRPSGLVVLYERLQRRLAGAHPKVEARIADRAEAGVVRDEDRGQYRAHFYPLMPIWNLFGDNVRRYGFVILAWIHQLDWYFGFILVPLNALLLVVWLRQRRADAQFLASGLERRM